MRKGGVIIIDRTKEMQDNLDKFKAYHPKHQEMIIDLGVRITDIVDSHAISDDEMVFIAKDVAKYVEYTRNINIKPMLFDLDGNPRVPRICERCLRYR